MKFRPCIDIHNGKVKQIVGGSLKDEGNIAEENYVSTQDGAFFASLYKKHQLTGGHIILLNPVGTPEYEADLVQARKALESYPGGMQIGGGVSIDNARQMIQMGASHVIVTSYVFHDGAIDYDRLRTLRDKIGKEHLVLDLSCRKKEDGYYVVTDRWQKFTKERVTPELLELLSDDCDEYLIHAVDVEGKKAGLEVELLQLLSQFTKLPVTYAGGVGTMEDLDLLERLGKGKIDVTIGSALDLFGGELSFEEVVKRCK